MSALSGAATGWLKDHLRQPLILFGGDGRHGVFIYKLLRPFVHFLAGLFVFLLWSFMGFLCIFGINPLSDILFAIIFSHPFGCLLTLLFVSLAV